MVSFSKFRATKISSSGSKRLWLVESGRGAGAVVSAVLATLGAAVATYLTIVHYRSGLLICGVGDCATVQQSSYAEIAGIPVAALGLAMYLAVLALGALRWLVPTTRDIATMATFSIVLAGTLYAAYLTYVEIWVIEAICQWCVTSAILTLGLLITEGFAVRNLLREP